jgi:putative FmdB family regulatory protein
MPTYEYRCKECGEHLEVVQSFKDDALTACPACGGPLRKVFGSIGIAFKGSGFYKTDSRSAAKSANGSSPEKSGTEKSGTEKSGTEKSGTEKSGTEKSATEKSASKPSEKASSSTSSTSSESKAAAS